MVPGHPLTAEEIKRELAQTYDADARATLIRAACLLEQSGQWEGVIPPLYPDEPLPQLPRRVRSTGGGVA